MPMKSFHYKRVLSIFLCLALLAGTAPLKVQAAPVPWPDNVSISAEGGIVMDADSGVILYGKNIHTSYYPASITKILTALLIIENFDLDDTVTFSHNAVFNVETGSSSAGLDVGDTLTVRDCLYAMLLRSANEAANALAEYASGSIEAFAAVMNAKARSLGCTDSHFNNPSGLNDPDHYTSAHDMALIAQAAFQNEIFTEIDSTLYYDLPPTKRNRDGFRIYPGHRMLKKNMPQYYSGIVGGKTGYTSLAGNTLVTCAERDGVRLIAVVLNGHSTHYVDTKALLDFGFRNFQSLDAADYDTTYTSITNDMTIAGLPTTDLSVLRVQSDCRITLPAGADFSDTVSSITYELPDDAPDDAIARILYEYDGRQVGSTYLVRNLQKDELLPMAELPVFPLETAETESPETAPAEKTQIANLADGLTSPLALMAPSHENDTEDSENASDPQDPGDLQGPASSARGMGRSANDPPAVGSFAVPEEDEEETISLPGRISSAVSGFLSRHAWLLFGLGSLLLLAGAAAFLLGLKRHLEHKEKTERALRYQRRQQRLQDIGVSSEEFDMILSKRRTSALKSTRQRFSGRRRHKSFLDSKRLR